VTNRTVLRLHGPEWSLGTRWYGRDPVNGSRVLVPRKAEAFVFEGHWDLGRVIELLREKGIANNFYVDDADTPDEWDGRRFGVS
jgi:hypothetical protein